MDADNRNEEEIFQAAIEIDSPKERDAYVKSACGDDAELLNRVEGLLKYHFDNKSFLKSPPGGAGITLDTPALTEGPGEMIGPYKLLQQIGEGGFGVVYMAEQRHPIQRKVALKIIKLGMDTKQVIARFEAERQALAMMDHPNIAKVLDAGATATGRPYFVMELVKGIPVTEYCDKNDLDTHQRLELFIDICKAVQHAHHKGIIHRDIKPSNILITLKDDDSPVPKVIDFGIAKATQARLTEKTLFTEFRQFIGTPEYMSPEQARMGEMGVDTRSDIYSLGVLLYELLTGTTPFDSQTLRNAGYNEIQRIISEDEPPKPSTRLSTLGDSLEDIAKHRKMAPSQLRREIQGELDWIILKALEKERSRRYESANELALDIQRHLTDEPVIAGPPGIGYRMQKFIKRNKTSVTVSVTVLAALIIGLMLAMIGFIQARQERNISEQQRQRAEANYEMARDAVDEISLRVEKDLVHIYGTEKIRRDMLEKTLSYYNSFIEQNKDNDQLHLEIGISYIRAGYILYELGNIIEARKAYKQAIVLLETLTEVHPDTTEYNVELFNAMAAYAHSFLWTLDREERTQELTKLVGLLQTQVSKFPAVYEFREQLADVYTNLGNSLNDQGRRKEPETYFRKALDVWEQLFLDFPKKPRNTEGLVLTYLGLTFYLFEYDRLEETEEFLHIVLELQKQQLADDPESSSNRALWAYSNSRLGSLLKRQGNFKEAIEKYKIAIAGRKELIEEFPGYFEHRRRLGHLLHVQYLTLYECGQMQEAECVLREAVLHWEKVSNDYSDIPGPRGHWSSDLIWLAKLLSETDRPEEALKNTKDAVAILEKLVEDYPDLHEYYGQLGEAYIELGKLLGDSRQLEQAEDTYKKAVAISTKAIELEPDNAESLNNFAWALATSSAPGIRDSAQAIEFANRACEITEWQEPMYIDTLAAAYAEAGDFDAAVKWQKKAGELLSNEIRDDIRSGYESRLRLYENGEPFHQE